MSKKKRQKRSAPKGWRISPVQVENWLAKAERQLVQEQYRGAITTAKRVLRYVPEGSKPYGEAHYYLGVALGMLQEFEASYEALTKALDLEPEDASARYNRALSARFLMRTGRAVRDLEQAVKLEKDSQSRKIYQQELAFMREVVQRQIEARGADATLDQLIEEQDAFWLGIRLMEAEQWAEAEAVFRQVVEREYVPPQPWSNLAACLVMQERYDEAEQALHRALEIEPEYEVARQNLAKLPWIREHGPSSMQIKAPFEGREIHQSITIAKHSRL